MATVIFKAVEKCNSNCLYCATVRKGVKMVMDPDLLETVFSKMNEYLIENPDEEISFTWHGGEVCLLGADYLNEAFMIQERQCPTTKKRIKHLVQSNLTLINQDIIDALKRLGIVTIGSSYEPIPGIRGFGSGESRDSDKYNRLFMNGITLLKKNNLRWGVIYVVNRKSLERPLDIFHFLTNFNLRSGPNLNKMISYDDTTDLMISPIEYADFLGAIFPYWYENRHRYSVIRPFSNVMQNLTSKDKALGCELSGICSHKWLYIGPDGETSHCGRAGDFNAFQYGNIQEFTISEILNNKLRDQIDERQQLLPKTECKDCRLWSICHGGCHLESYFTHGDMMHRTPFCEGTKHFIEKYVEPITGLRAGDV